jgi:hypothetical protein
MTIMDTPAAKKETVTMTTRAETLAVSVEKSTRDLLATVESSTPEQWSAACSDGEWTQGFAAYHAAFYIEPIAQQVREVANGRPFPKFDMAETDASNAVQAHEHGDCTIAETVALLDTGGPVAAGIVRSLNDDQLDIKVQLMEGMPEVNLEMMIQLALVGHTASHLATIAGAR